MSMVLVDSSAWIDFFRGVSAATRRLDSLLAEDRAATTAIIAAEVVSGAPTQSLFDELRCRFRALPVAAAAAETWDRVADARFALARQGVQAHLVDLAIAQIAADTRHRLLTRDRDFVAIARVIAVDVDIF